MAKRSRKRKKALPAAAKALPELKLAKIGKAVGAKSVPVDQDPIKAWKAEPKGMKVPNHQGYMDKERLESEEFYRRHLGWLKAAQDQSRAIHKVHQAAMDELAAETLVRRKRFIATNREYAKTLGKFDDYRGAVRKMEW